MNIWIITLTYVLKQKPTTLGVETIPFSIKLNCVLYI